MLQPTGTTKNHKSLKTYTLPEGLGCPISTSFSEVAEFMHKTFKKECAYCSHKFETKNPKQSACSNCKALLEFASGAMAEVVNA